MKLNTDNIKKMLEKAEVVKIYADIDIQILPKLDVKELPRKVLNSANSFIRGGR